MRESDSVKRWGVSMWSLASRIMRHSRHENFDEKDMVLTLEGLRLTKSRGGRVLAPKSDLLVEIRGESEMTEDEAEGFYMGLLVASATFRAPSVCWVLEAATRYRERGLVGTE